MGRCHGGLDPEAGGRLANLIFLTGGCRSGKSDIAVQLARQHGGTVAMLVPCVPADDEMKVRVARHRAARPADWPVYEEALQPAVVLRQLQEEVVIFDCLPTWIGNLLVSSVSPESIDTQVLALLESCVECAAKVVIVVSAEVGLGLVPDNALGRKFRDHLGLANQHFVRRAENAYFLVSGVPINLKQFPPVKLEGQA